MEIDHQAALALGLDQIEFGSSRLRLPTTMRPAFKSSTLMRSPPSLPGPPPPGTNANPVGLELALLHCKHSLLFATSELQPATATLGDHFARVS